MKSPASVLLTAAGASPWIPLDYIQHPFQVTLAGIISSGATLTWAVQYTYDDTSDAANEIISITRAATVATVVWPNHELSVNDTFMVQGSGSSVLDCQPDPNNGNRLLAWTVASVVDANTITYTVTNSGPTVSVVPTYGKRLRVFTHATLTGQTTRNDSNFNLPCRACRFQITAFTSGRLRGLVTQGGAP